MLILDGSNGPLWAIDAFHGYRSGWAGARNCRPWAPWWRRGENWAKA